MKRSPLHRYTPLRPRARKRKRIYIVDRDYVAFVCQHPCMVHGSRNEPCDGAIDPHHVGQDGLRSIKRTNDYRTVPLCLAHHLNGFGPHAIHKILQPAFEERFNVSLNYAISSYQREWQEQGGEIRRVAA